jgi:hypothetical protein
MSTTNSPTRHRNGRCARYFLSASWICSRLRWARGSCCMASRIPRGTFRWGSDQPTVESVLCPQVSRRVRTPNVRRPSATSRPVPGSGTWVQTAKTWEKLSSAVPVSKPVPPPKIRVVSPISRLISPEEVRPPKDVRSMGVNIEHSRVNEQPLVRPGIESKSPKGPSTKTWSRRACEATMASAVPAKGKSETGSSHPENRFTHDPSSNVT